MDIVKQNEVLLKHQNEWLYFSMPHEIIVATNPEEVPGALSEVERQVQEHGWHAAGFLSYEAAPAFDPVLRTHAADGFPYLWFGLYPQPRTVSLPKPAHPKIPLDWHPTVERNTYNAAVDQILEYIAEGRTYQVNYTMRLQADFDSSPWEFFLQLAQTQNQQGAYVDAGRYVICSASPELFFTLDGETITSRPMKGTASRGTSGKLHRERSSRRQRARRPPRCRPVYRWRPPRRPSPRPA